MDCGECAEVSLADERLKTNVSLGGHLWNSRTGLLYTDDGMVGRMPVSSAGKLPFGPKGAVDDTTPVCPSPQTGVLVRGTWLVCVSPKPPSHCTLRTSKPRDFTFEPLVSQKPDPSLSRTTPISSANLSFFPATWFSSLKPPHDLLFEFPNTEAPKPLQLLHHWISGWFQVLLWAGCPCSFLCSMGAGSLEVICVGKNVLPSPILVFRRCKKAG